MSIRSTSSHTTLTRTCCLLSSLDLSAEQWQLSTIRSGQFLLLRLDSHSPTAITHSKLSALMVDRGSFNKRTLLSGYILPALGTSRDHFTFQPPVTLLKNSLRSSCGPNLMPCCSPAAFPTAVNFQRRSTWEKRKASGLWHAVSLPFSVIISPPNCFPCSSMRGENFHRRALKVRINFIATHPFSKRQQKLK